MWIRFTYVYGYDQSFTLFQLPIMYDIHICETLYFYQKSLILALDLVFKFLYVHIEYSASPDGSSSVFVNPRMMSFLFIVALHIQTPLISLFIPILADNLILSHVKQYFSQNFPRYIFICLFMKSKRKPYPILTQNIPYLQLQHSTTMNSSQQTTQREMINLSSKMRKLNNLFPKF